jgi:acyl-CoA synthetase (AMP-forming)/AMP-acid ligase II
MMIFLVARDGELITASPRFDAPTCRRPMAVSIGSAPARARDAEEAAGQMPQASVINSYGLTEAGPGVHHDAEGGSGEAHRLGRPADAPMEEQGPSTRHRRSCAPPNDVGELLVRLPGKRREYYKDDGANASTWTPDGWLRTGDLAYLDEDGFVYISGRIKDMIIRGGNNIYATDVEAVLLEHADVQEAAVVGVPHTVLGEDVGAFVVCKPDTTLTDHALLAFCAEHLADYKRPRHLWFVAELPRNATGKVMKHKLRDQVADT